MMKQPKDSQWEAVRETDRHLLVVAGAGTGKTFTVVAKILYLLGAPLRDQRLASPLRLDEIAAITFTNQAAADLKDKLRSALREVPELRHLAYEVDGARIGTIHAFCGDILREFALRGGRGPATRVVEEDEGGALAAEAVHDALLGAIESESVEGLQELFAEWSVTDVTKWMRRLIAEGDRLHTLLDLAHETTFGDRERTILELARLGHEALARRLERDGAVDFDRMIVWTRDLIRDSESVRSALQRRLKVLIIDEFQDVDPAQRDVAYLLGDPRSGRGDTTRLVLVGDPKQSIYRFRRADVTVWTAVQRDFEAGMGVVTPLRDSFRSVAPVLAFVDHAIGPVLDHPVAGAAHQDFEVPYQPVSAIRADGPSDRAVELIVTPAEQSGKAYSAERVRAIDAETVARRMRRLHDAEGVAWKDIAIVLTGWGALGIYEAALARQGIPTYALRVNGFFERREVVDMILALQTLRDPRDERALFGFLRSPFVGVADETLLALTRHQGRPSWTQLRAVECSERALLRRASELLERHVRLRDRIPTAALLESLLAESGYLAHLALLGADGEQPLANVRKFLRMAAVAGELEVGGFLREIADARERAKREDELLEGDERLRGESDDVVTITSVHSAKGLEWKVVFWCDLVRGRGPDYGEKLLVGRDSLLLGDSEKSYREQSAPWMALWQRLEEESAAEQKRLWYVAATRAADRLILSGIALGTGTRATSPAAALRARFAELDAGNAGAVRYRGADGRDYQAIVSIADPALVPEPDTSLEPKEVLAVQTLPPALARIAAPVGRARHSATELMSYERCAKRHWFKYVMGLREPALGDGGAASSGAMVHGQIVHDVLEHLRVEEELDALLEEAIGRWDPDAPTPESTRGTSYRVRLREEIAAVSGHPDYRAIADQPTARRELPFLYIHAPGLYAEGKMDLAAATSDGLVLLDVKTGGADAAAAQRNAEHYAPQRDLYVTVGEGIAGTPVSRFAFQFSKAALQLSEPVSDDIRQHAIAELERMATEIGRGAPELTRFPAECGHCGYRRVRWCPGVPPAATPSLPAPRPDLTTEVAG